MPLRRSTQAPPPKLELRGRLERQSLRALGATGGPHRRVQLRRPIRRDGQTLDAPTQAMLALRDRLGYPAWHEQPVELARRTMRHEALVAAGRPIAVAAAGLALLGDRVSCEPAARLSSGVAASPAAALRKLRRPRRISLFRTWRSSNDGSQGQRCLR